MTIIAGLRGNFGNQLFVAATALSLAAGTDHDVLVDYRSVRRPGQPGCRIKAELLGPPIECRDWNVLFAVLRATPHTRLHRRANRDLPFRQIDGFQECRDAEECRSALAAGADIIL